VREREREREKERGRGAGERETEHVKFSKFGGGNSLNNFEALF
jgi:hypothetical protein